jgi:prepilin-type processing-associated H-X9-DG protein
VFPGAPTLLPRLVFKSVTLNPGGDFRMIVLKQPEVDLNKSISADTVHSLEATAHRVNSTIGGLNALFADGHVVFQNARGNPAAFNPLLWTTESGEPIGNDGIPSARWRTLMAIWRP